MKALEDEAKAGKEALRDLQAMVAAYDGSVPFPEFAEIYLAAHPSKYDLLPATQFIMPANDPRNRLNEMDPLLNRPMNCKLIL